MIVNKLIQLIAHHYKMSDMIDWVRYNSQTLQRNKLVCTGTTGKLIKKELDEYCNSESIDLVEMVIVNSGPLGGDAEIAAMVVRGEVDLCIFFIDDLTANPHEADIQMLLRQCRLHDIPVACNRHSADLMITSDLWGTDYKPVLPKYEKYER